MTVSQLDYFHSPLCTFHSQVALCLLIFPAKSHKSQTFSVAVRALSTYSIVKKYISKWLLNEDLHRFFLLYFPGIWIVVFRIVAKVA